MTQTKEDLVESFSSLETAVFKRKIYGVCVMYGMANYKILKEKMHIDMFPSDNYYTIDDQKNELTTNKKKYLKQIYQQKEHPLKLIIKKRTKKRIMMNILMKLLMKLLMNLLMKLLMNLLMKLIII